MAGEPEARINRSYQAVITNVLLFLIVTFLFLIYQKMPPTLGEIQNAKDPEKVFGKMPFVKISGSVDVDVDTPLQVEIDNQPIEVEVSR